MSAPATLLIVDDNEVNRDALSRRLERNGYATRLAEGGHEALAYLERDTCDLVLLDVEMPGMSGLEVLARLRETRSSTELPVIMVTARAQGADVVEAFRLGANDYVTKPVDFPVALSRISTHLAHKRAVEALRSSEERYALAVQGANDGVWDWDLHSNHVHWSERWQAMLGYTDSELGSAPDEWLNRIHADDAARVRAALQQYFEGGSGPFESEHRLLHKNGSYRWVQCRGGAVRTTGGVATRFVGSLSDVTETKVADVLTGLPNRLLFTDLLSRAIKRAKRRPDYAFALLLLGLDRFKFVNNGLGAPTADRLLVEVSRRLQTGLRGTDVIVREDSALTLARLGGEEFSVFLDDVIDPKSAILVGERLREALRKPFEVDGHQVYVSASVGIALSRTGYDHPEEILRDAAIALQRAVAEGSLSCEIFDGAMRERALSRLRLESEMQTAIDTAAFMVHYQPVISIPSGQLCAFESLVRWRHPLRGMISPGEFIPVAEETGMLAEIGHFVLVESCHQMARWIEEFGSEAPAFISVNISPKQLAHADCVETIESVLRQAGLDGARLHLEITESAFMQDEAAARATLDGLKALRIEWSIDDFGTGYSSLSYLHRLQAGAVKVDRSFVSRLGTGERGTDMVKAIVGLARNLGMTVIAEGVETPAQLAELGRVGCDYAQGFYFSKAVDAAAAAHLIRVQPWRSADPLQPVRSVALV